jgi:hypothetical protein
VAQGALRLPITDVRSEPITGMVDVGFEPETTANNGAGGASMDTGDLDLSGATELTVDKIECLGGPGTLYRVSLDASNYKTYTFFQRILEKQINKAADGQIRLAVNPARVKNIEAPAFNELPKKLGAFLAAAKPIVDKPEDTDIAGLTGAKLYDALGPLRKAGLLNLFKKATHSTSKNVFKFMENQTLLVLRQDRFFSMIDPAAEKFMNDDKETFKSAPDLLHEPPPGFELHNSFKSRDDHANIQLTLLREIKTGKMAADVDIDESSGIEHGLEVIKNAFKGRTNPYLVRELLILSDVDELTLDPGYGFLFK